MAGKLYTATSGAAINLGRPRILHAYEDSQPHLDFTTRVSLLDDHTCSISTMVLVCPILCQSGETHEGHAPTNVACFRTTAQPCVTAWAARWRVSAVIGFECCFSVADFFTEPTHYLCSTRSPGKGRVALVGKLPAPPWSQEETLQKGKL